MLPIDTNPRITFFFENGKMEHFDFGGIWGYYFESCQNRHKSCYVVSIYYPALFCMHSDTNPAETVTVHFHKADLRPVFILPFMHISKGVFVKQKCEKQLLDPKHLQLAGGGRLSPTLAPSNY